MASSVMMRLTTERSKVIFSDIMPMQALVAQAKALRWRRAQTLYFFGSLFVSFTYLIWLWISVKNIPVTTSGTYDTSGGLFQITTSGCNIAFRTDNAPTWTHEAVGGSYVAPSTTSYQATFVNAAGCQGRGKTCGGKCTVTIGVPPEAKDMTFKVGQDPSDDQKPVVSVGAGVTFANLNMGADHSPQPSVSLEIYSATITGLVDGWLSTGTFKAVNASIGDVNFVCETSSMWLLDHPINPSDIDIVYRAGGNSFCAAVDVVNPLDATFSPVTGQDNQGNAVDPGSGVSSGDINPLMHCNIGRAIVGSPQQVMYGADYTVQTTDPLQWFVDQYDPDGDNLVTRAEFINGLSGLGCCGPECPFESDCSAQAYEAGVADTQGTIGSGQVNVYTVCTRSNGCARASMRAPCKRSAPQPLSLTMADVPLYSLRALSRMRALPFPGGLLPSHFPPFDACVARPEYHQPRPLRLDPALSDAGDALGAIFRTRVALRLDALAAHQPNDTQDLGSLSRWGGSGHTQDAGSSAPAATRRPVGSRLGPKLRQLLRPGQASGAAHARARCCLHEAHLRHDDRRPVVD